MPDLGITGLDDVLTDIRRITDVCSLPLFVDVDTGFGPSAFNVARTVQSLVKFGAAGMHIEDQVGAKRCGHRPGKQIVPQDEMVDRIKAAVDARTDAEFVVMARTDALAVEGLDAAIARAVACVQAGADAVFPEAVADLATYRKFAEAVGVPILANLTEFGQSPLFTVTSCARQRGDRDLSLSAFRAMNAAALKVYAAASPGRDAEERGLDRCRRAKSSTAFSTITLTKQTLDRVFAKERVVSGRQRTPPGAKSKKSVALSGVFAGTTALCPSARPATICSIAATTSSSSPTGRVRGCRAIDRPRKFPTAAELAPTKRSSRPPRP